MNLIILLWKYLAKEIIEEENKNDTAPITFLLYRIAIFLINNTFDVVIFVFMIRTQSLSRFSSQYSSIS